MAAHSSNLAWEVPLTEETGRLHSIGLQRVRHDLVTEHASMQALWGELSMCYLIYITSN